MLQEVDAIRLGLPLPPPPDWMVEEADGDESSGEGVSEEGEGSGGAVPVSNDNGGLSPAAVGGIVAAAVFVAAVSLGLALWMARSRNDKPPADITSSSRRSYLMGADYKSEEGESVREFVKTKLGRAGPRRKSSGHVGSMGSGMSSAQSIAASSGNGRSDAQLGAVGCSAVGCSAAHVHPSHMPHCCSHGAVRPPPHTHAHACMHIPCVFVPGPKQRPGLTPSMTADAPCSIHGAGGESGSRHDCVQ